ncbi:arylsulfatase [Blastopirellula retiformator]|uniref:Arylsulfatase n=1 Tax=Blastopirellula retiformator TaxID=2527970 RepID=A0A5C5VLT3_9BACT|nr:arylsulfatase [Blastopirellula retiformator]TWT39478.1 Arylsulfatase [Blastopirellula retiformator]
MPQLRPFLLALFALCLLPGVSSAAELARSQPNIILIMTDDQGYAPVGRHGHPWIETPNMDKLYDQSVRFTRMLVAPTCSPTRSALMTGRHPMRNGITHTILERERMTLDAVTLPQTLKKVGYTTGIFGKWHLGDEDEYQPHHRGFDEAFIHGAGGIGQAYDCSCADAPGNKYFDPALRHNGKFVKTDGYCTDLFFTAALGWIKEQKDRDAPFFAYIVTNAPHSPFIAPEKNAERFTKLGFDKNAAGFYGMIENIDENLGRVMQKLDQWRLADDTVVIFMSDNGMSGGVSGKGGKPLGKSAEGEDLYAYNAGMKGLKGSSDEGGVRVPFFVHWKGKIEPNRDVDRIAGHIDVFPTIADLAGAPLPEGQVEGRSLLPLVENAEADWKDRYLFTHQGRWPTGAEPNKYQWEKFAVRNQKYRLVGENQLFDMEADPGQKTNVIDGHPDVAAAMKTAYDAWWKGTRPMMVNETAKMSPTKPFWQAYYAQEKAEGIPAWVPPQL